MLLVACAGCSSGGSRLALDSFKDPYFPERYSVSFSECAYRIDPSGDHHILARTVSPIAPGQGPIEQWLHIHVFWKPRPGKTPDNPTSTDAVIRYVISTPDGLASYRGTGYVYPQRDRWTGDLVALLESGRLRLDLQRGDAPDLLGEARLTGRLRARNDGHAAVDLVRRMDVLLGTAVHAAYAAPGGRP